MGGKHKNYDVSFRPYLRVEAYLGCSDRLPTSLSMLFFRSFCKADFLGKVFVEGLSILAEQEH